MFHHPCSLGSQPSSPFHPFAEMTSHSNMYLSALQQVCDGFSHSYSYRWIAEVVQASALSEPEQCSTHLSFHSILYNKHVAVCVEYTEDHLGSVIMFSLLQPVLDGPSHWTSSGPSRVPILPCVMAQGVEALNCGRGRVKASRGDNMCVCVC